MSGTTIVTAAVAVAAGIVIAAWSHRFEWFATGVATMIVVAAIGYVVERRNYRDGRR